MTTFSLCMIVKNEAAVLERCLDSIADLMDEIIIVDTGSSDNTKQIAARFTDKIYDYTWIDDFADARNFAFSKASMDYIYSADADEVLDKVNHDRLATLKEAMLPEIEMVQMYYVTPPQYNTTANFIREYRPKLFRRLRTFTWIDPVHETVRLSPVVFDSDIEITHLPQNLHSGRDFDLFQKIFRKNGALSEKLHSMYAKELFISGKPEDFADAAGCFGATLEQENATDSMRREAICVLARNARKQKKSDTFFLLAFRLIHEDPCAELCYEIGRYFMDQSEYGEAVRWLEMALSSEAIIDIHCSGSLPLSALADCYNAAAKETEQEPHSDPALPESFRSLADDYRRQAAEWSMPSEA